MTEYRRKQESITAIQFIYSHKGIKQLKEFCSDKFIAVSNQRHIYAVGEASIKTNELFGGGFNVEIAKDSDYIIKSSWAGCLTIVSEAEFKSNYEAV